MEKYITRDRETGTMIDKFAGLDEAIQAIKKYEAEDKKEETFTPDFYEVANSAGETVWAEGDF